MKTIHHPLSLAVHISIIALPVAAVAQTENFRATVLATGVFSTSPVLSGTANSATGGTRMLWYPRKAAFRAGSVSAAQWTDSFIGNYSVALGQNTTASAANSTAFGNGTSATQANTTAFGVNSIASGPQSTAFGNGTMAPGDSSTSMGVGTMSGSYASTAMGRYNTGLGSPDLWNTTDPLFEIGNGTSATSPSNALTVFKSGDMTLQGNLTLGGTITSANSPVLTESSSASYLTGQGFVKNTTLANMGFASTNTGASSSLSFGGSPLPPYATWNSYAYTFGGGNTVSTGNNFVWGKLNNLDWNSADNLVLGYNNDLNLADDGFFIGSHNTANSDGNMVFGSYNNMQHSDGEGGSNSVIGSGNNLLGGTGSCSVIGNRNNLNSDSQNATVIGSGNSLNFVRDGNTVIGNSHSLSSNALAKLVLGDNSAPPIVPGQWRYGSNLMIIGNGLQWLPPGAGSTFVTTPSNALEIHSSGATTLKNRAWSSGSPLAVPTNSWAGTFLPSLSKDLYKDGNALVVDGHTVLNGKVIISVPQGDISMGIYQ